MAMGSSAAQVAHHHWLRVLSMLVIVALCSCGRFGVELLSTRDAGRAGDGGAVEAGGPYHGCDAATCDYVAPVPCEDATTVAPQAICGCGRVDTDDADGDGVPDCIDFCPGVADQSTDATCACAAADADPDGDGAANCKDRCPFDGAKQVPGVCGCGAVDTDSDGDNIADCVDACDADKNKVAPGECGCGRSDLDSDLDRTPDCVDACSGAEGAIYPPDQSCGLGYCRATNRASTCVAGVETACMPGTRLADADATCDGIDDDCDGQVDDDYVAMANRCGLGVCASTGVYNCSDGKVVDSCSPGMPLGTTDATCDAKDDDCDGRFDEDVAPVMSSCAVGACSATGAIACVAGQLIDSCQASAPISSSDATCNNVDDDCNGQVDEDFVSSITACGVGACARTGIQSCMDGVTVNSCSAPKPSSADDSSCNRVDDDCDGRTDEGYATVSTSCGIGVCAGTGVRRCDGGRVIDSCMVGAKRSDVDDATVPGNGLDDDCDGRVDEDLPACDTTPRSYEAGAYALTVPGNCRRVTVQLWGGGGGAGQSSGISGGGDGGPGGYATASVLVATPLQLFVGTGGSNNCNTAGSNAGSSNYNGGSGGTSVGADGADSRVSGGGSGATPSSGYRGGDGFYGGGGGGEGNGGLGGSGAGGGGGAASVLVVNGAVAAFAGGGGGGGGAESISLLGTLSASGGHGGSGCRGNGQTPNANGGGGGGGGACSGGATQAGSGTTPANSGQLPNGRARGGASSCAAGGAGYAIVTFSAS